MTSFTDHFLFEAPDIRCHKVIKAKNRKSLNLDPLSNSHYCAPNFDTSHIEIVYGEDVQVNDSELIRKFKFPKKTLTLTKSIEKAQRKYHNVPQIATHISQKKLNRAYSYIS